MGTTLIERAIVGEIRQRRNIGFITAIFIAFIFIFPVVSIAW